MSIATFHLQIPESHLPSADQSYTILPAVLDAVSGSSLWLWLDQTISWLSPPSIFRADMPGACRRATTAGNYACSRQPRSEPRGRPTSDFSHSSHLPARTLQNASFLPSRDRFCRHASIPGEVTAWPVPVTRPRAGVEWKEPSPDMLRFPCKGQFPSIGGNRELGVKPRSSRQALDRGGLLTCLDRPSSSTDFWRLEMCARSKSLSLKAPRRIRNPLPIIDPAAYGHFSELSYNFRRNLRSDCDASCNRYCPKAGGLAATSHAQMEILLPSGCHAAEIAVAGSAVNRIPPIPRGVRFRQGQPHRTCP